MNEFTLGDAVSVVAVLGLIAAAVIYARRSKARRSTRTTQQPRGDSRGRDSDHIDYNQP